jgi:hypothetical protein
VKILNDITCKLNQMDLKFIEFIFSWIQQLGYNSIELKRIEMQKVWKYVVNIVLEKKL